jgi:cytochrome c-type biogenesis protein CcmE
MAVVLAAFAYLFLSGMEASQVYYLTVSEFNQRAAELEPGEPYRVSGRVQPGSIDLADNGLDLQFTVYDPERDDSLLAVTYHGVVPDSFMENSEVVVEGALGSDTFEAHELLAKCPSKYEALVGEEEPPHEMGAGASTGETPTGAGT